MTINYNELQVEICATLLTDKPPKLPLREELPSLGFEVIYNAHGAGMKAVRHEAKRAVHNFRKSEEIKELKKRRFFPKSSKRIKEQLAERKRIEYELGLPHAFSYETYERELNHLSDTGSSSGYSGSSSQNSSSIDNGGKPMDVGAKRAKRRWGLLRKRRKKKQEEMAEPPSTVAVVKSEPQTLEALIGDVTFQDFLAPLAPFDTPPEQQDDSMFKQVPSSDQKTASASYDYSTQTAPSRDPSSLSTPNDIFADVDVQFVATPTTDKFLPDLNTVEESEDNDSSKEDVYLEDEVKGAFSDLDVAPQTEMVKSHGQKRNDDVQDSVKDAFAAFDTSSRAYRERPKPEHYGKFVKGSVKDTFAAYDSSSSNSRRERPRPERIVEVSDSVKDAFAAFATSSPSSRPKRPKPERSGTVNDTVKDAFAAFDTSSPISRPAEPEPERNGKVDDSVKDAFAAFDTSSPMKPAEEPEPAHTGEMGDSVKDAFAALDVSNPVYGDEVFYHPQQVVAPHIDIFGEDSSEGSAIDLLKEGDTWIESSKHVFENVAAQVYKATGIGPKDAHDEVQGRQDEQDENNNVEHPETGEDWISSAKHAFENMKAEVCKATGMQSAAADAQAQAEAAYNESELRVEEDDDGLARYGYDNDQPVPQAQPAPQTGANAQAQVEAAYDESELRPEEDDDGLARYGYGNDQPALQAIQATMSAESVSALFAALARSDTNPHDVQDMLNASPEDVQVQQQQDGRLPLHTLCDRSMPDRSSTPPGALTDILLKDIASYKKLLKLVVSTHPEACCVLDSRGDLPVHLAARGLMEWEASWYESVYQQAAHERNPNGKTAVAITRLYHTMSECIEELLRPMVNDTSLCRAPGSVGMILPAHIATVFAVSVHTLRLILEAYPEATTVSCNLDFLESIVPDDALPLELHDKLSTDFPKWEVEAKDDLTPEIKWSQARDSKHGLEDCMRRSDLLFAYSPIEPYRFEKTRIRRIESRIQFEAKRIVEKDGSLTRATELLWIWMCAFREPRSNRATYVNSVKRIIDDLPLRSVRCLASVETRNRRLVIDDANPECTSVIRRRLEHLSESIVPIAAESTPSSAEKTASTPSVLRTWEDTQSARLSRQGKGFVSHLCRLIFNVKETSFPTSFVILPYKLSSSSRGRLGIASADSAPVAAKFAKCLLHLTDPRSLLYFLDCKSVKHYEQSIYDAADHETRRRKAYAKIEVYENSLLSLYEPGEAYLYLIDEATGAPRIPSSEIYPIILSDPASLVRKLLPLMMVGMVLLRGEKAPSVLISLLLDDDITVVAPKWVEAAQELNAYLLSQETKEGKKSVETTAARNGLSKFVSTSSAKQRIADKPKNGNTEWNVELSILKMLIDMNDPERSFAGLEAQQQANESVLWTAAENPEEVINVQELSSKHDELLKFHAEMSHDYSGRSSSSALNFPQPLGDESSESEMILLTSTESEMILHSRTLPQGDDTFERGSSYGNISDYSSRKPHSRKYSLLFQDFAFEDRGDDIEAREPAESPRPTCPESERVWDDMTTQLNRAGTFADHSKILHLRVHVAEEAKKLAFLGRKVSELKQDEMRLFSREEKLYDLLHEAPLHEVSVKPHGLTEARKLVIRLCELEERLLCNEIEIQHLSLGAYSLDRQIDELYEPEDVAPKKPDRIESSRIPPEPPEEMDLTHLQREDKPPTHVIVFEEGEIVEQGRIEDILPAPKEDKDAYWVKYFESTGQIEF